MRVLDERPAGRRRPAAFDVIGEGDEVLLADVNWTYGLTGRRGREPGEFVAESMKWSCRICASTALMRTAALPARTG